MPHFLSMFDADWLRFYDLAGQDRVVTITKVVAGTLEDPKRRKKDKKPVVHFKGWPKPLALNKTNAKTIAGMYGPKTEDWVGKRVTLYPAQTQFGNDTVDCVRVRPKPPEKQGEPAPQLPEQPREPGSDDDEGKAA